MVLGLPFLVELDFELVFEEWGKPEYQEKNLSEQGREPATNSTHIIMPLMPGNEPRPHLWEWNALNTAPPFLPKGENYLNCSIPAIPYRNLISQLVS